MLLQILYLHYTNVQFALFTQMQLFNLQRCYVILLYLYIRAEMFVQMLCGTEPHPKDFKAKKYKLDKHALSKEDFVHIMKNLPVTFIVIDNLPPR